MVSVKNEKYCSTSSSSSEISSADDISELLELVEQYFSFLTETIQGQDRPVVDLLLDNLVTDHDGNIFPIDQEWRCRAELLDPESMFCRGIVYFLSRNALVLDRAPAGARSRTNALRLRK